MIAMLSPVHRVANRWRSLYKRASTSSEVWHWLLVSQRERGRAIAAMNQVGLASQESLVEVNPEATAPRADKLLVPPNPPLSGFASIPISPTPGDQFAEPGGIKDRTGQEWSSEASARGRGDFFTDSLCYK